MTRGKMLGRYAPLGQTSIGVRPASQIIALSCSTSEIRALETTCLDEYHPESGLTICLHKIRSLFGYPTR